MKKSQPLELELEPLVGRPVLPWYILISIPEHEANTVVGLGRNGNDQILVSSIDLIPNNKQIKRLFHPIVRRYAQLDENPDYTGGFTKPLGNGTNPESPNDDEKSNAASVGEISDNNSDYESIITLSKPEITTDKVEEKVTILTTVSEKPANTEGPKQENCPAQKESLLAFGKAYGERLKTWLSKMSKLDLTDENASFEKEQLVGKFKVERGFMDIDTNIVFQPSRFRYYKNPSPPAGAVSSLKVVYQYLIPKIGIHYNYSQEIVWSKTVAGTFDVLLSNQLVVILITVIKNGAGVCSTENLKLDITFNIHDIAVTFKVNGGGFLRQGVSYVGKKVMNSYIIRRLLPLKVKTAMLGKLEYIRSSDQRNDQTFPWCQYISFNCD